MSRSSEMGNQSVFGFIASSSPINFQDCQKAVALTSTLRPSVRMISLLAHKTRRTDSCPIRRTTSHSAKMPFRSSSHRSEKAHDQKSVMLRCAKSAGPLASSVAEPDMLIVYPDLLPVRFSVFQLLKIVCVVDLENENPALAVGFAVD